MPQLPAIITECLKRKIPVEMEWDSKHECPAYIVYGFCKSSTARVIVKEDGTAIAFTRYGQEDVIEDFRDLAYLAYEWWMNSCQKTWFNPASEWVPSLIEYNFIKA